MTVENHDRAPSLSWYLRLVRTEREGEKGRICKDGVAKWAEERTGMYVVIL